MSTQTFDDHLKMITSANVVVKFKFRNSFIEVPRYFIVTVNVKRNSLTGFIVSILAGPLELHVR